MDGEDTIWGSALGSNGIAHRKLKSIEKALDVVITREKSERRLRFYGPPEKLQDAVRQITEMLKEESCITGYEIDLNLQQFSWAIHSGFKSIEQALGKNIAVFNVVSRRITIHGTQPQYETAMAIMDGRCTVDVGLLQPDDSAGSGGGGGGGGGYCPICFCEADNPIQTSSCKHTYCLECFEELCKKAPSTNSSNDQGSRIQCPGSQGTCSTIFTLGELKALLSSSVFEAVLQSSFEEYLRRRPDVFHHCPTAGCDHIYRCTTTTTTTTTTSSSSSSTNLHAPDHIHLCPNCLHRICTSCHAAHGHRTCAEYRDMASGNVEALETLKRELHIQDCPRRTTPIEKTDGCNHVICPGCRAHLCWLCLAVFDASGPCYDHMNKVHGGIGLEELERFMD